MNYCSWASFLASKFRDHQTYFSDQISDRNSWRIPESPAFFVQEFWKNFRDRYLWTFPVTKRLLFRREFWSIASHEEFQGHLLFVTGKYSLWHKNPVFVMNYCSWTSFLTSGFEIIKHIFPTGFPIGILEEFRSHLLLSCRNSWIIWNFLVTKWLLFRRQFWSIGINEEFQGHLLFLTGNYSSWHGNLVFLMNDCSRAYFPTGI